MKAWIVCEGDGGDLGCALVRADTRGKAKRFHPNFERHRESFLGMRVLRQPWLDGDGPARALVWVDRECEHPNYDDYGYCPDCFEGWVLDRDETVRVNS